MLFRTNIFLHANRFNDWYERCHWLVATLAILVATYAAVIPVVIFSEIFDLLKVGPGSDVMESAGVLGRLFLGSIFGPLIETITIQWAPIRLLHGKFRKAPVVPILISAVLFALTHSYSVGYAVLTFFIGVVLAYGFQGRDRPGGKAFMIVFIAHALRNLTATIARAF